ncbi:unnamed protein product [Rotaria sp. Silwood2]|nr:unnamed protein product [Rotaria sp. Silwood2]CAF2578413.1 unnamed protein product [Rotaria sp. Silwood2]CAF2986439.1 unnamed protein product [Rotaria sp. Silwood2]CAF3953319.1 unnamed protein product [Rotaria sp. Silwood2]CAF4103822.1 unnamed protein product [Rotaria sp. Silwood2]
MLVHFVFLSFSLPFVVFGSGITTHIEVSHRAQELWLHQPIYQQYVLQYQDALQAGSPYPDIMYDSLCYGGSLHQVAEDTHWYPFMKIAIEYMRNRHPPPLQSNDVDGQKLLVFLLGVASHQIADAAWHGNLTDCPNGFIDATAWESFNDSREMAHSSDDTGGDCVINYELPVGYIGLINNWYVPSNELEEIYAQYAIAYNSSLENNATATTIQTCSDVLFGGRFADALLLGFEYPTYSSGNSFLLDQLHEYYYGGLPNMARLTVRYWDQIIAMYEHGIDICTLTGISPYYLNCIVPNNFTQQQQQELTSYVRSAPSGYLPYSDQSLSLLLTVGDTEITTGLISNQSYAAFGHATLFGDFNGDRLTDLVVSAPDYYVLGCVQGGRVFIIYGQMNRSLVPDRKISIIEGLANQTLISPECDDDRFGSALACLDWNNDGFDDLVVSSPSHGFGFRGAVFVFAGDTQGLQLQPYMRIDGVNEHDEIGFELLTAHLDNDTQFDLIITSPYAQPNGYNQPQQGAVWIFLSSDHHISDNELTIANASFTIWGETAKSKFGYSLEMIPPSCINNVTYPVLMISAPADQGKLFVYSFQPEPHLIVTLSGKQEKDRFGQSFSIYKDKCLLAVGSPTRLTNWYGGVDVLLLSNLFHQSNMHLELSNISVLVSIYGDMIFGRLGTTVQWTPNGNLCISAPLGKRSSLPLQLEKSIGRAYVISANKIPAQPNSVMRSIKQISTTTYVAQNHMNRFGSRTNILSSTSASYYVISSPFTTISDNVRLPGMLYFLSLSH